MTAIDNYHAHVYFSAHEHQFAARLQVSVREAFGDRVPIGGWHSAPVGPHPRGSYQLTVAPDDIGEVLSWLAVNRGELTVFVHLNTGQDYLDHSQHVIWLGNSETLKLDIFKK